MVKVASETITSSQFYDRFFALLQRYLAADSDMVEPKVEAPLVLVPQPSAAASAASAPSVTAPASAASATP